MPPRKPPDEETSEDILGSRGGGGGGGRPVRKKHEKQAAYAKRLRAWYKSIGKSGEGPAKITGGPNMGMKPVLTPEGYDPSQLPGRQRKDILAKPQGRYNSEVPPASAPLYEEGMQWEPTNWGPDEIWGLQQALIASGYAGDGLNAKVWDEKSANAFEKVLKAANVAGVPWQDIITAGAESEEAGGGGSGGGGGGGGGGGAAEQVVVSNPSDLAETSRQVGQKVLGRETTDEEAMRFAANYQSQEVGAVGQTGAVATRPPSEEVAAQDYLRATNPREAQATDMATQMEAFYELLNRSAKKLG